MSNKEEKAREYAENLLGPHYPTEDSYFNSFEVEEAFESGWDAAIVKAYEFLKSYRRDYPDGTGYVAGIIDDETIKDFKKYMEE